MLKEIKKLVKEIKDLEEKKTEPFRKVNLQRMRKEITQKVLSMGVNNLEIGQYILQIGYVNKDTSKPYTMIFTKESFIKHKEYRIYK